MREIRSIRVTGGVRFVRNFWIKANIDGRETKVEAGPVAKNGGFLLHVY